MTLYKLIKIASSVYPDGLIEQYWDKRTKRVVDTHAGDTLALFIAWELQDTYDKQETDAYQLQEACRVVRNARDELDKVFEALYEAS